MQVKALSLPLRTGVPTQAYSLVSVVVDDGGSKCKRGLCISGYCVERWSLSEFDLVLLKGHDSPCKMISGLAGLQVVK